MITKFKKARDLLDEMTGVLSFGDFIKSLRLSLEFTQVEMAKRLKISRQDLCDIEKGRKSISVERAIYFAKRLNHSDKLFAKYVIDDQLRKSGLKYRVYFNDAA